jgi:hypothetical protein
VDPLTVIGVATKRCRGACGQDLPLVAFCLDRSKRDGLNWRCRACQRDAKRGARTQPKRVNGICRNCRSGRHGRWCLASLFGPWCPCGCRAVLGLDGPFEFADPSAPDGADLEGVA